MLLLYLRYQRRILSLHLGGWILRSAAFSSAGTASKIATPPVIPKIAASKADFMWVNLHVRLILPFLNSFYGNSGTTFSENRRNSLEKGLLQMSVSLVLHTGLLPSALISDALPAARLCYTAPDDATGYAKFYSRSHVAVIRVYDETGNMIQNVRARGRFQTTVAPRVSALLRS